MSEAKRKLFGLFRSRSSSERKSRSSNNNDREHRQRHSHSPRSRPERSHKPHSPLSRLEPRNSVGNHVSAPSSPAPQFLTEWPPPGFTSDGSLSQGKAMELIASGVPVFKGIRRSIVHASEEHYSMYACCEGNGGVGSDRTEPYTEAFKACSLRLQGPEQASHPWETLEQPSLSFCCGNRPGTITLNHWVSLSGNPNPPIELRDPGVRPREVELSTILERLVFLEGGFEEDYEELLYKNLYKTLLRDPDKFMSPHKAMEKQIADLITVLSRPEWVDFSRPENQVVAKFFANATYTDQGRYKTFFHQLLLSMELYLRINSKHHAEWAKEKLLSQLPPCIAWDLALARKWRDCMSIEKYKTGGDPEQIRFHLRVKKAQVKALRTFARAMKWPNLLKVDEVLKGRAAGDIPLEDRSSDTMSYFTGVILPGVTLPWLIMNSLIDCDSEAGSTNDLAALTHMHPCTGFQYRGTTYWSACSIVGKVLAPTCREVGGWIGPARPAPDLARIEIARIRQRRPRQYLTVSDVESMAERSDPLGPPSDKYPLSEYQLALPEVDPYNITDTVRIEKLALKPVLASQNGQDPRGRDKPLTYDAAIQFAVDGKSWPLRLSYDVSFVAAYPCARGPHPLFFDYDFKRVRVDELLTIKRWGGINPNTSSVWASSSDGTRTADGVGKLSEQAGRDESEDEGDDEAEKVLLVDAYGVADNEVLARAWASHWGLSALLADVELTCVACAVREAYAACLNVVILVEGRHNDDDS